VIKATGGGQFDANDKNRYFLAGAPDAFLRGNVAHETILVAVDALGSERARATFDALIETGRYTIFLDSGIYALAMQHAKLYGLSHNEALNLAPENVQGFDQLWKDYHEIVNRFGDRLWGYVELDLGGVDQKRKTRAKLEANGLAPIPVYHPLLDGWDYFDELASGYDRICVGNIVTAPQPTRRRLLATITERKKQYPHLWIHALGLAPNAMLYAYPIESCDSSSWLSGLRWAQGTLDQTGGGSVGRLPQGFRYELGSDSDGETGQRKAMRMGGYVAQFQMENWRNHLAALDREGLRE
jgi:hypothetical protein